MKEIATRRLSPLTMPFPPDRVMEKDGWTVARTYPNENGRSPLFLADLSHIPQWSIQGNDLDDLRPEGLAVPKRPGEAALESDLLIVRLTPREGRILYFGDRSPRFNGPAFHDVGDGCASFALAGQRCLEVLDKLSAVDLEGPGRRVPCAAQAPAADVVCLLVRLYGNKGAPGLLVSCARSSGPYLLGAFLEEGEEYGLAPAGWDRFTAWLHG